jgi:DNA invertase Pin-like site-specific DNA recombinase
MVFVASRSALMSRTFIAYLRVSTDRQGRSGLGLEAQQAAIAAFLKADDKLLLPPFTEVESGKNSTGRNCAQRLTVAAKPAQRC